MAAPRALDSRKPWICGMVENTSMPMPRFADVGFTSQRFLQPGSAAQRWKCASKSGQPGQCSGLPPSFGSIRYVGGMCWKGSSFTAA